VSLEFGLLMMLIGIIFVFSSLAVIAAVCVALKRFFRAETPAETYVQTPPTLVEAPREAVSETMGFKVDIDGRKHSVKIEDMSVTGKEAGEMVTLPKFEGEAKIAIDGQQLTAKVEGFQVKRIPVAKKFETAVKTVEDVGYIRAPMHGSVVKINVKVGDHVEKGSPILILEAMKMESVIESPSSGVVEEIKISEGDNVESGKTLVIIGMTRPQ